MASRAARPDSRGAMPVIRTQERVNGQELLQCRGRANSSRIKDEDDEKDSVHKMSLPNLAAEQGQIGGWEFAMLSFPR